MHGKAPGVVMHCKACRHNCAACHMDSGRVWVYGLGVSAHSGGTCLLRRDGHVEHPKVLTQTMAHKHHPSIYKVSQLEGRSLQRHQVVGRGGGVQVTCVERFECCH